MFSTERGRTPPRTHHACADPASDARNPNARRARTGRIRDADLFR